MFITVSSSSAALLTSGFVIFASVGWAERVKTTTETLAGNLTMVNMLVNSTLKHRHQPRIVILAQRLALGENNLPVMDAKEETLNILNKIWVKLQGLPNASPIELGAFFVILTFILVVLLMTVVTCLTCCCRRKTKARGSNI